MMSGAEIAGIVLLAASGLFALIFGIAILPRLSTLKYEVPSWLAYWSLVLAFTLLVAGFSFMSEYDRYWLIGYAILIFVLVVIFAFSFFLAFRLDIGLPGWLADFWNVRKGFGGNVFGDTVGAIAVLAGIVAYQVSGQEEGWFWFALFAVLAACLIGLSQVQRGVIGLEVQNDPGQAERPFKTDWTWDPWAAFFTLAVSSATLLAMLVYTSETTGPVREWWVKGPAIGLFALFIILLIAFFVRYRRAAEPDTPKSILVAWVLTFIFVVGAFVLLWVFQYVTVAGVAGIILTAIATGLGAGIEVINIVRIGMDKEETTHCHTSKLSRLFTITETARMKARIIPRIMVLLRVIFHDLFVSSLSIPMRTMLITSMPAPRPVAIAVRII
ncbi:MAG TPA: hypothetical protein VF498_21005, partial [Anaerolineales bacterium]